MYMYMQSVWKVGIELWNLWQLAYSKRLPVLHMSLQVANESTVCIYMYYI